MPFSPLSRGLLSGGFGELGPLAESDMRRRLPRFDDDNLARNLDLVAAVVALAEAKGCTPAQIALAWVMAQGEDIVPIPGTRQPSYLKQNAAAVDIELTEAERTRLAEALPLGAAAGARYPEAMMRRVNL